MKTALIAAAAWVLAALPIPAAAETIEDCGRLVLDRDRLACYDRVAGRDGASGLAGAPAGQWNFKAEPSQFTADTNVYLSVESADISVCGRNRDDKVVFWIRCREDTTTVMFQTSCHMTSGEFHDYGDVHYQLDGGPADLIRMTKSRDSYALGLWRGEESIPFVRHLLGADVLSVRMKSLDSGSFTVTFPISGLDDAIVPLRQACHW